MSRTKLYWICQIAGWGGFVAANLLFQALAARPTQRFLAANLTVATVGLISTHLIRLWIRSHHWLDKPPAAILGRALAASVAMGLIIASTGSAVARWADQTLSVSHTFLWMTMLGSGVGLAWVALYLGAQAYARLEGERRRAAELEAASQHAELQALKAQLDPHFMFNSLNAVRSLIDEDPKRARDAVTRLAALMRYFTRATKSSTVPLVGELDTVRSYLALEQIRFEQRLETIFDIDSTLNEALVPPLALQTLVENAIKHAIARTPKGGCIRLTTKRCGFDLHLEVGNTGSLRQTDESKGIGLANLRQRLELLYGDKARLDLREHLGEVVATVVLPMGDASALA